MINDPKSLIRRGRRCFIRPYVSPGWFRCYPKCYPRWSNRREHGKISNATSDYKILCSFQHKVSYRKMCMTWPLPGIGGGGKIQFWRIHQWRRVHHIFAEKYECIHAWALHFWYFWLQLPKLCYWKYVCLLTLQSDLSRTIKKYSCFFLVAIPLFHISHLSEHMSKLSLRAFPDTQHPHILMIHKSYILLLSFDQSFQLVTCSNWRANTRRCLLAGQLKSWTIFKNLIFNDPLHQV